MDGHSLCPSGNEIFSAGTRKTRTLSAGIHFVGRGALQCALTPEFDLPACDYAQAGAEIVENNHSEIDTKYLNIFTIPLSRNESVFPL